MTHIALLLIRSRLLPIIVIGLICGCGPRVDSRSSTSLESGSTTSMETGSTTGTERIGGKIDVPKPGHRNSTRPARPKKVVSKLATLKDPDRRLVEISTILAYRTGRPGDSVSASPHTIKTWWETDRAKTVLAKLEELGLQIITGEREMSRSDQEVIFRCTSWWSPPRKSDIPDVAGKISEAIPVFNQLGEVMHDLRAEGFKSLVTLYFYDPKTELAPAFNVLREVDMPFQLSVWYYDFNEADCTVIAELPTLESLHSYHTSATAEGVAKLATSQTLHRFDASFHSPQQKPIDWTRLGSMPQLEEIKLSTGQNANAAVFLQSITGLTKLRSLHLSGERVSENAFKKFMTQGDRSKLEELSVTSEPTEHNFANELKHAPLLRKLSVTAHRGWVKYLVDRLVKHNPQVRELQIQISRDQEIHDDKTDGILISLTRLSELEDIQIPIHIQHSSPLEPLVRLRKLKSF